MNKQRILSVIIILMLAISATCFGYYFALTSATQPPETTQLSTSAPTASTALPTTAPNVTTLPPETTQPTQPVTQPQVTEPSTIPTEPPTQPTEPPTQPTEPPTQPTEPPTQPTEPPTQPTEPPTQPPVEITLSAKQAFVYDLSGDMFLHIHGDLDQPVEPASITKLFSAYVGLQYLSADTLLTAGEEVNWIDPYSSRAYIYEGHQLTVELCVQGMIIPSGNDAAYVLAVNAGRVISGDPEISARSAYDAFVAEMNRQAQALGMTGTHFVNPDGMNEDGHYTTMRDLLIMAKLALDTPVIRQAAATPRMRANFPSGHYAQWVNSNQLLDETSPEYYCAEAFGLKTGSTSTAGKCLLSVFRQEDRILLVCVMGCPTNQERYIDTLTLYRTFS